MFQRPTALNILNVFIGNFKKSGWFISGSSATVHTVSAVLKTISRYFLCLTMYTVLEDWGQIHTDFLRVLFPLRGCSGGGGCILI
jgi:hypothetical protein